MTFAAKFVPHSLQYTEARESEKANLDTTINHATNAYAGKVTEIVGNNVPSLIAWLDIQTIQKIQEKIANVNKAPRRAAV